MQRANSNLRTNTGLPEIEDKSPDNRPKTRRLEGGGDFPLISFFTRRTLVSSLASRQTLFPVRHENLHDRS